MVEVVVPKDIMAFKTTLIGPFTTRQTVCGVICAAVEYAAFKLVNFLGISLSMDTMIGLGVFLAVPILAFCFVEPCNMPLEKYLKNAFVLGYLAPKVRVYETVNLFDEIKDPDEKKGKEKQKKFSQKELKMHPDYIMYE